MRLIRGHRQLRTALAGSVVTLGSFDGIHRGHQQVLQVLGTEAAARNLPSVVVTTEPLPREYFLSSANIPPRLTGFREKMQLLAQYGVDYVLCEKFDASFACLSAEAFVQEILLDALQAKHIILGDDTHFGYQRQGNMALLQRLATTAGFGITELDTHCVGATRISSTRIRALLEQGELSAAAELLGRPYHMSGRVVHGDQRGRTLGYPTANILLKRAQTPLTGVFAVQVAGLGENSLPGVASLGIRPTFGGGQCLLEVHLFDFKRMIYGEHLDVYFVAKLREEQAFSSVTALTAQMQQDVAAARDILKNNLI